MDNKIITLAYLKMNFSQLLNCNKATKVTVSDCGEVEFESWLEMMTQKYNNVYCDIKQFGIDALKITYESGIDIIILL